MCVLNLAAHVGEKTNASNRISGFGGGERERATEGGKKSVRQVLECDGSCSSSTSAAAKTLHCLSCHRARHSICLSDHLVALWIQCIFGPYTSWCNWRARTDCVHNVCVPSRSRLNARIYFERSFYCVSWSHPVVLLLFFKLFFETLCDAK